MDGTFSNNRLYYSFLSFVCFKSGSVSPYFSSQVNKVGGKPGEQQVFFLLRNLEASLIDFFNPILKKNIVSWTFVCNNFRRNFKRDEERFRFPLENTLNVSWIAF